MKPDTYRSLSAPGSLQFGETLTFNMDPSVATSSHTFEVANCGLGVDMGEVIKLQRVGPLQAHSGASSGVPSRIA